MPWYLDSGGLLSAPVTAPGAWNVFQPMTGLVERHLLVSFAAQFNLFMCHEKVTIPAKLFVRFVKCVCVWGGAEGQTDMGVIMFYIDTLCQ